VAAETFENVAAKVEAHCPLASNLLARLWVQNANNEIEDRRPWSHLRSESEILISASKSGTVNVTGNSATVVLGTLAATSADKYRQFRIPGASGPVIYTILDVAGGNITLDRVYGGTTAAGVSALVLDAYISMPEDFGRFIGVLDPANNWQLNLWMTEDELNSRDAQRTDTGSPYALVSRRLSTANASGAPLIQYELWPYQLTAKNFPYFYIRRPRELADGDTFQGPLRQRTDVIMELALAMAAEWPGTVDKKNPYFSLPLAQAKRAKVFGPTPNFDAMLELLEARDEEVYMTWMQTVSHLGQIPYAPGDANWARAHE